MGGASVYLDSNAAQAPETALVGPGYKGAKGTAELNSELEAHDSAAGGRSRRRCLSTPDGREHHLVKTLTLWLSREGTQRTQYCPR